MKFPSRTYPSKVLLFGEHTVLIGSSALAVPYPRFSGHWTEGEKAPYDWWMDFIEYLIALDSEFLHKDKLESIKDEGYVTLDIPIGYGLGSSGALCAAIYDLSAINDARDKEELQERLGSMESFFHGRSSGYDPLVSLLNKGIQKGQDGAIESWDFVLPDNLYCYLLDSGQPRSGKTLIGQFRERSIQSPGYYDGVVALNNSIIDSLTGGEESDSVLGLINQLSTQQYQFMQYMIVTDLLDLWKESLTDEHIAIKICGAGGGGYYLVFSDHPLTAYAGYDLLSVGWKPN